MSNKKILLEDKLAFNDNFTVNMPKTIGFRTEISCVNDYGEILFEKAHNQTVLGGAIFTMLKLFNVNHDWNVATLNELMNIANDGTTVDSRDNYVCLFGVGTGGAGDSAKSVKDVKVYEREIEQMIPLRLVNFELSDSDKERYWFKKQITATDPETHVSNDYDAYYLKTFDMTSSKILWKDGVGESDGSDVEENVYATNRTEPIQSFIQCTLRIDAEDCKEWFKFQGDIEVPRINSLALFTGVKSELSTGEYEYKDVRMFSKLNIDNQTLQLDKGMTFFYRIYILV